jgi:S-adenosylmethionine hydrolase
LSPASTITLTTDFGLDDWFVGTMKGVIASVAPEARTIDLTHQLPPGNIRAGAFALAASYRFFPKGTIHVAIVDPGVGGARKAIVVQTGNYRFIGPDNGLLSWALRAERVLAIHSLQNDACFLKPVSRTFHGRDIFAPVAAHLSRGVPLQKLGPPLEDFSRLPWPEPQPLRHGLQGEILYLDHFGNAITNLDQSALRSIGSGRLHVRLPDKRTCPVTEFYQAVPPGRSAAVIGSSGFLEIAINGGSAARRLRLLVGQTIVLTPRSKP